MTYNELSKSKDGTTLPVPTALPAKQAPPQTKVVLEKSTDHLMLFIPKIGCSFGACGTYSIFGIFLAIFCLVTVALAKENQLWYVGTALSVLGIVVLPWATFKKLNTEWKIVIQGGQLKIIESLRNNSKERAWPIEEVKLIESRRRIYDKGSDSEDSGSTNPSCLLFVMKNNVPFLERYVQVGVDNPDLDDDTLDWMAREIAHFAETTVVIPDYPSSRVCCP